MAKKSGGKIAKGKVAKITANMTIEDVIKKYPEVAEVFFKHGMPCIGCAIAASETVGQAAAAHGINLKKLLEDLNNVAKIAKK